MDGGGNNSALPTHSFGKVGKKVCPVSCLSLAKLNSQHGRLFSLPSQRNFPVSFKPKVVIAKFVWKMQKNVWYICFCLSLWYPVFSMYVYNNYWDIINTACLHRGWCPKFAIIISSHFLQIVWISFKKKGGSYGHFEVLKESKP